MKNVPTENDWKGYERDLDAKYAHKMFFGKTNKQMQKSFSNNVIERMSEIQFMPKPAFQYYVFGFRDYVMAQKFPPYEASDAASCFLSLIREKMENSPDFVLPILSELKPALQYIANHQNLFEADEDIYGNFSDIYKKIIQLESNFV